MSDDPFRRFDARFDQYEIGYGKPPKDSRFKSGQSGNPRGRPKGSKNSSTIIQEALERKITVKENGRERQITAIEAVITKLLTSAIRGDTRAIKLVLDLLRSREQVGPAGAIEVDFKAVNEHFRRVFERAEKCADGTGADQS